MDRSAIMLLQDHPEGIVYLYVAVGLGNVAISEDSFKIVTIYRNDEIVTREGNYMVGVVEVIERCSEINTLKRLTEGLK